MVAQLQAERLFDQNLALAHHVFHRLKALVPHDQWEDARAEALVGLWKASRTFDPARGTPFGTYAAIVIETEVRHFARRLRRKRERYRTVSLHALPHDGAAWTPEETLGRATDPLAELRAEGLLRAAAAADPAWVLYHHFGFKQREIAKMLGTTQGNVSKRIRRASGKLRALVLSERGDTVREGAGGV